MADCDGVVLAAGLSRRTGRFKMELPLRGKTVIQHSVEGMAQVARRVMVVVGWREERVRELLASLPGVEFVPNPAYEEGMFSSVRAGIACVHAARFFLLPGDQPLVRPETYARLLPSGSDIVIPTYGGRKGHPVLISSHLIPEILAEPPTSNLREYIARHGYVTVAVDDPGVLLDVDTLDDYRALQSAAEARDD